MIKRIKQHFLFAMTMSALSGILVLSASSVPSILACLVFATCVGLASLSVAVVLDRDTECSDARGEQQPKNEYAQMSLSSMVSAILSIFMVVAHILFQAYFGFSLFPLLTFEELCALFYLLASTSWLLIRLSSTVKADDAKLASVIRENEATIMNICTISFFVVLKSLFALT